MKPFETLLRAIKRLISAGTTNSWKYSQDLAYLKEFQRKVIKTIKAGTFRGFIFGLAFNEKDGVHLSLHSTGDIGSCQKMLRELDKRLLQCLWGKRS